MPPPITAPQRPGILAALQAEIRKLEARGRSAKGVLPFGVAAVDARLPDGGLSLGALHEVAGGGRDAIDGAVPALFAAAIAARTRGPVLWCLERTDLFPPGLAQAGLGPDRVTYLKASDDATVLACFEEGLRHGGLGAVVGEVSNLPMTASRRLQLAAEESGTLAIAVRRWRRPAEAIVFGHPTSAATRWRVSALPSSRLPVEGVGRARWWVELMRCRAGESAAFELEAPDQAGRLALPLDLASGRHRRSA